jgi:predicted transposase YbfD/YdcC
LAEHLDWPGLAQVCRIERWREFGDKKEHEIAYAITSVPRAQADAAQLLQWNRGHWCIENCSHYVRDVTFGEDASQIHKGVAPQIFASLRNAAISFLRSRGVTNIAAELRDNAYQVNRLLARLGIMKK